MKIFLYLAIFFGALCLTACGGGSANCGTASVAVGLIACTDNNSNSSANNNASTAVASSTLSPDSQFPLQSAYKKYFRKWLDGNFTASGTCSTKNGTITYQLNIPPAVDGSFNGQVALAQTPVQVGGLGVPGTSYYDPTTLNFLGNRDPTPGVNAYIQVSTQVSLPQFIKVGDNGKGYIADVYSGTTKTNQEAQTYTAKALSDANYLEITLINTDIATNTGKTMGLSEDVFWIDRLGNVIAKSHKSTQYDLTGAVSVVCTMTTSNSL
jgi:hypothetical protein